MACFHHIYRADDMYVCIYDVIIYRRCADITNNHHSVVGTLITVVGGEENLKEKSQSI